MSENFGRVALPCVQSSEVPALAASTCAPVEPLPVAAAFFFAEERLTRLTPSARRRPATTRATFACDVVQPPSSIAGTGSDWRSGSDAPSTETPGVTVARIELTHASCGRTRATSAMACAQSKRLAARLLTVWLRCVASCEKSV